MYLAIIYVCLTSLPSVCFDVKASAPSISERDCVEVVNAQIPNLNALPEFYVKGARCIAIT